MKHSEHSVAPPAEVHASKAHRILMGALLATFAVSGCAAKPMAGAAARAPQTTTTQEMPTPVSTAPTSSTSSSPESHSATPTTSSAELAKSINTSMETIVRRMQNMEEFETGNLEDGRKWVAATVLAPAGPQLAPLVETGRASAYRLRVESSANDTIVPAAATIGAYYNTAPDGSPSDGEHAAFELRASVGDDGAWSLAARTEGGYPWDTEGQEALDNRDALLSIAAQVASNAVDGAPIIPYNE